ncbi:hypothetical protein C4D60_Mb04t01420 [Musa balbisiana]|uniref:Beta-glucosidase n=1 Tax=Musa balbisiana TaxID=52838 RepID=A0A4S8K8W5_MUSBA|nr:hypothetical protein C4D60_Mb04t01420 [Musa balbisiana]
MMCFWIVIYEGAAAEGGKGASIWDTFTHMHPEVIADRSNGDVAVDSYHRYKEDISFLKYMGMDAYRFSISWPRILPSGSLSGGVNMEGIRYYNNLINDLRANGMKPFVTLFHWDLPQELESRYQGFLSPAIVDDYRDYAEICFKEFGDRVKHWITFNEPWTFCRSGYLFGVFAPGRCSPPWAARRCSEGDSSREPYLCAHHQLLAHAAAVRLYRDKYQVSQRGEIGITLISHWFVPYENSKSDADAVARALDFMFGWFMDPLSQGDYPFVMRALVGDRLPEFTAKQSEMVKGSFDFIGLNYYTTYYANSSSPTTVRGSNSDSYTYQSALFLTCKWNVVHDGHPPLTPILLNQQVSVEGFLLAPRTHDIYISVVLELGVDEVNNASWPLNIALQDDTRIDYHRRHLSFVLEAMSKGAKVRGYFAWSLLDNFEWISGYTVRFGLVHVDYKDGLKRYPKASAHWFQELLKN